MESYYAKQLECLCSQVRPGDREAMEASKRHWNKIAKPLDGLGRMEDLLVKIAGVVRSEKLCLERKAVVVFCADNGVVAEGVTQTGSEVTAVVTEMTMEQTLEAIHTGIALAGELKDSGYDLLAVGEMGIGNTTTSSAIASVMLEQPPEAVTGRGAGLSGEGLERKIQVIQKAIVLHGPDREKPLEVLSALGGLDIAAMTGFLLGGAIYRIPVVLDGMISAVAALLAAALCPGVTDYLLPSHLGKEPACRLVMERLGFEPVIHGQLALGEGTGAVMLYPLLDMAASVYEENSTFADIKIKAYESFED